MQINSCSVPTDNDVKILKNVMATCNIERMLKCSPHGADILIKLSNISRHKIKILPT